MFTRFVTRFITPLALSFSFLSCGQKPKKSLPQQQIAQQLISDKARYCLSPSTEARAKNTIPEIQYVGPTRRDGNYSQRQHFEDLRMMVQASCKSCHQAPSRTGQFTYLDEWKGSEKTIEGILGFYQGYFEVAEKMLEALESGKMPPPSIRNKNPEAFERMTVSLKSWIQAGKPQGSYDLAPWSADPASQSIQISSELGECTPDSKIVGTDFRRDREFESMSELPENLAQTDLFTLDAFELAKKGTVAYNVEYPLWADNAEKGRWIHLPAILQPDRTLGKQAVVYDRESQKFKIPQNSRFYKTFYKLVKQKEGKERYRRIETRLIVVRYPSEKSLFGTYRWDETEQSAALVRTPYRDGSAWKDNVFEVTTE